MAENLSLRRSLRTRSLEARPSPYVSSEEVPISGDADDDDGNNNANGSSSKEQVNGSIQPNRRALRKRKVSFKESSTDVKKESSADKMECDSIGHLQKILSDKWYVDYYDNDRESVFDVKTCCLCPKKFFTNFALKKHFDLEHKKNKFSCQSCDNTFSHADDLTSHERQMHPVRLMSSAMFYSKEVQDILRDCIKQDNTEITPQLQRQRSLNLSDELQTEQQNLSAYPPVLTRTENVEPPTETQPQKFKLEQTEQIFKIPSLNYQQRIKTPLKNQLQNFHISRETKQKNFLTPLDTQSKQPIVRKALKRKHSFQNSPTKVQNQNLQAPTRTRRLDLQEPLISTQETPPPVLPPQSLEKRQSFLQPNYCDICKKKVSQAYMNIHMQSVHEMVRYKCESCKKTDSTKSELRRHVKFDQWGEKFECRLCPQIYRKRSLLRTHTLSAHAIHQH